MQLLGTLRLAIGIESEAFLRSVAQPLLKAQSIALRLGNLLPFFVKEHLIDEAFWLATSQHLRNLAGLDAAVCQVLAIHFIVNAKRNPAHGPIDLPLKLCLPAQDRLCDCLSFIIEADDPGIGIDHLDRDLQDNSALRADRENGRIGCGALLAQRRQHDVHDRLIMAQDILQRLIERARIVALGRRDEFILETEPIKKLAEHRIVVMRETFELIEGVGNFCQRLAKIGLEHLLVRHIIGDLAKAIHIVRKCDQSRRHARQGLEGVTNHCRAQHFIECTDMRQS